MKPIVFEQANRTLSKPSNMTDDECSSLSVFSDGSDCISLWQPSWRERLSILFFGRVWLFVHSGHTQPPVLLLGINRLFK